MLGKGQQGFAFTFFKTAEVADGRISGEAYTAGAETGAPVLASASTHIECRVVEIVEQGDHHIAVGEVIGAGVAKPLEGRADDAILWMKDLGEKVFYGG